ncbi:MAG TPA: ORF6N domain-containing protein [Treponemataceae bacterium]|nr:ORF6N domain-containing protein [Treponemataceae bacterium]
MNNRLASKSIQSKIFTIRGVQVMIDKDLAEMYQVETKVLNQAVKRNSERFPLQFRFQLSSTEKKELVTNCDRFELLKHSSSNPFAFTEQNELPQKGIFYNGQVFDSWKFASDLIRSAQKSIVLIDNYIDDSVLSLFAKRSSVVSVTVLTKEINKSLEQDVKKFNAQYPPVTIKEFKNSHDRFLIIDDTNLYHFGASLKDLGKKWFAFSKMDIGAIEMLENLKKVVVLCS